ncbi:hypothetical protein OCH80_09540 [Lactobacillus sp. 23-2]|uniref:hypothetical protein n=1 Tax=Lactobacillus sp. 23-2 TaxID=2981842 RepID=UPI00383415E6
MPKEIIDQAEKVLAGQLPLSSCKVTLKDKATAKKDKINFHKGDVVYASNLKKKAFSTL